MFIGITMQRWTLQLEGGPCRVNHAAVAYRDFIYTFGGYCTGEDYNITRPMDTHKLNTVSFRWTALPLSQAQHGAVPYQRYGHTAVCFMDCAYIWGGRNNEDGACNNLYCFDMTRYQWSKIEHHGLKPDARDGHSACLIGPKMYIFGGFVEQVQRFSNDVHYMDLATMTWNQVRTKGIPARFRDFHSATAIGNVMYVFGGRSDLSGHNHTGKEFYDDHIIMFDTITNRWLEHVQAKGRPMGRRSHSAFTYNDELYIFGGYNGDTREHFRDLHKFNPKSQTWSAFKVKGFGPSARRRQCCCVIGSKAFLFGGTSPRPEPLEGTDMDLVDLSDMHILDFAPTLKTICMLAVLQFNIDQSCLPCDVRWDLSAMTTNNTITRPMNSALG